MFEQISVDATTGAISYPKPDGFTLDMDAVYRSAGLFVGHCSVADSIKHAIHGQLAAFRGMQTLRPAVAR